MAAVGIAQVDRALRPFSHCSGWLNGWPLPSCTIFSVVGRRSAGNRARPCAVSVRTRCFIDTVSPVRSSVRSITVWARRPGAGDWSVGRLKRQDSIPFCQLLKTKAWSAGDLAPVAPAATRAVTNKPGSAVQRWLPRPAPPSSSACGMRACPLASVLPRHSGWPRQSCTMTCALATGRPRSSVVTQARLLSRPCLKCRPRLVTSTPVRTYIGCGLSSSDWPSRRDSISTTW